MLLLTPPPERYAALIGVSSIDLEVIRKGM